MIGSSGWSGHSETAILDQLTRKGFKASQITALYTERSPCPDCASELASALKEGTPITWSVPYDLAYEKEAKALLAAYIRQAGGF